MRIFWSENSPGSPLVWAQLQIIENRRVTIVHLKPALIAGWNYDRFEVQDGDAWGDLSADEIVEWKRRAHHDIRLTERTTDDGRFIDGTLSDLNAKLFAWLHERGWRAVEVAS